MPTKEVAPATSTEIAPLYDPSSFNIDAGDIALPKVYICNALTKSVQDDRAKSGDVIVAAGPDDPDAEVVYATKAGGEGLLFRVLRLDRGKSFAEKGEKLQTWAYDDPAAHPDSWTTYTYTVILPEVDPEMPHRFLRSTTSRSVSRRSSARTTRAGGTSPSSSSSSPRTASRTLSRSATW